MVLVKQTNKPSRFKGSVAVTLRGSGSGGNDPLKVGDGGDVGISIDLPTAQTANAIQISQPQGTVIFAIGPNGAPAIAAGLGMFGVAHAIYNFATDGGAIGLITPALNVLIPANAIVMGGIINPTTAPVGATATIAFGTSAGSSATSLKAATAIATYSIDALLATVPVFTAASSFKMSAAGNITLTVAVAPLTAGIIEVFAFFVMPTNA
jgi:hypothetical protein